MLEENKNEIKKALIIECQFINYITNIDLLHNMNFLALFGGFCIIFLILTLVVFFIFLSSTKVLGQT